MITDKSLKKALVARKAQKKDDKAFKLSDFLFPEQ